VIIGGKEESMNEIKNSAHCTPRSMATYAVALGLLALAASIVYFSFVISSYRNEIPEILKSIEQITTEIEPLVTEVESIRSVITPILQEAEEVRKQIPAILEEVRLTREQIPRILDEVAATRNEVPKVLKTLDDAGNTLDRVVKESAAIRKITPQILTEVKKTRESIPSTLNRVDELIADARNAGHEAGSGAVSGFLTGIVTAPFTLVGGMGQSILGMNESDVEDYSEKDIALLTKASEEVLSNTDIGAFKQWRNSESDYNGIITLKSIHNSGKQHCRIIHVQAWKSGIETHNKDVNVCKNEAGSWKIEKD
jgi:uncharacterized protein YoxC/surface antigen